MKKILIEVTVPDATDENAITVHHHVKPYPVACSYKILHLPTDMEIIQEIPKLYRGGNRQVFAFAVINWYKSKLLNQ
jgi:hypothetical protein